MTLTRAILQQLTAERVRDAEALLAAGNWSGAYYMIGYAVECALKACYAKLTGLHDFPDKEQVMRAYTHNLEALVEVAGLLAARNLDLQASPARAASWTLLKDWSERSRYRLYNEPKARDLYAAVTAPSFGVLPWIMARW